MFPQCESSFDLFASYANSPFKGSDSSSTTFHSRLLPLNNIFQVTYKALEQLSESEFDLEKFLEKSVHQKTTGNQTVKLKYDPFDLIYLIYSHLFHCRLSYFRSLIKSTKYLLK